MPCELGRAYLFLFVLRPSFRMAICWSEEINNLHTFAKLYKETHSLFPFLSCIYNYSLSYFEIAVGPLLLFSGGDRPKVFSLSTKACVPLNL